MTKKKKDDQTPVWALIITPVDPEKTKDLEKCLDIIPSALVPTSNPLELTLKLKKKLKKGHRIHAIYTKGQDAVDEAESLLYCAEAAQSVPPLRSGTMTTCPKTLSNFGFGETIFASQ
jgi:hypothetical protein